MNYKTLLVHADDEPGTTIRVQLAAKIAANFGGHLVVIYSPRPMTSGNSADDNEQRDFDLDLVRRITASVDVPCQWEAVREDLTWTLIAEGRCADLIVSGPRGPGVDAHAQVALTGELLLATGRPVLIVPAARPVRTFGERIVIAWSGTRESARAIADALPLLAKAKAVQLLAGVRNGTGQVVAPVASVMAALARHGVKPALVDLGRHRYDVGEKILAHCAEFNADVLVMGAYGHSRARELTLGGVTQTVLESMRLPVLMSH